LNIKRDYIIEGSMIDGSRDGVEGNENEYLMGMVANEVYNF